MNNYEYKSRFANDIKGFISFRCALGYQEFTYSKTMTVFDQFCLDAFPHQDILTQEIVEKWALPRKREHIKSIGRRLNVIRLFGRYIIYIGKSAYVAPSKLVGSGQPFTPYIYDDNELKAFFYAADRIPPSSQAPYKEYIFPVLFRIQYCCGLRPSEVRLIKRTDLDHETGILTITEAKNHRDRNIVLSEQLLELCSKYDHLISQRQPSREYYFEHPNGGPYTASQIQDQFKTCWRNAGITFRDRRKPRVYDARHNYASRILSLWMEQGYDVKALLPYLSEYMGHSSLESTAYYIHLIPERLHVNDFMGISGLFPEVPYDY